MKRDRRGLSVLLTLCTGLILAGAECSGLPEAREREPSAQEPGAGTALRLSVDLPRSFLSETAGVASRTALQTAGWSSPVRLSETDTPSVLPDVAADSAGNVYIVWAENLTDQQSFSEMLFFRKWNGREWCPPANILYGRFWTPSIAVDSQGRLHVVWQGFAGGVSYSWAWGQGEPSDPHNWAEPVQLPSEGVEPWWPIIRVDSNDNLHVIWSDVSTLEERKDSVGSVKEALHCLSKCRSLWYTRSVDHGETWSEPVKLSQEGSIAFQSFYIDSKDRLYAVWGYSDWGRGIGMTTSSNGGKTWAKAHWVLEHPELYPEQVGITATRAGTIVVAWTPGPFVSLSSDGGVSWSGPELLPSPPNPWIIGGGDLRMVVDNADILHLFVTGHWMWDGTNWRVEDLPSLDPCASAACKPKVALSEGNVIHLAVQENIECALGIAGFVGRGDVFYMRYQSAAPAVAPIPLPPVPSATPVPPPTSFPTAPASPVPTVTPPRPSYLATDSQPRNPAAIGGIWIGVGLAAAFLVIVVIALAVRRRRASRTR